MVSLIWRTDLAFYLGGCRCSTLTATASIIILLVDCHSNCLIRLSQAVICHAALAEVALGGGIESLPCLTLQRLSLFLFVLLTALIVILLLDILFRICCLFRDQAVKNHRARTLSA